MAKDPYRYFRIEAREILETLSGGILRLEAQPSPQAAAEEVERLLRASHTLKGAAAVVGNEPIAARAHRLESLIAPHSRGAERSEPMPIAALFGIVDAIALDLANLDAPSAPGDAAAAPAPAETTESVRLDLADVDAVLASLADVSSRLASARSNAKAGLERLERPLEKIAEWLPSARPNTRASSAEWEAVAELVQQLRHDLGAQSEAYVAAVESAERRAHEALEGARRLRLLPAETLFTELGRAARDAAAQQGRRIEIESSGGELRLDAHVLGILREALLQLVRNVVAHALEPETERRRAGKPEVGRLALRFEGRGFRAIVRCLDDGRGIDEEAIRAVLVARGVMTEHVAATADVATLVRVMMRHGVTTRSSPSELAGRGVGLRVVGEAIDRLRGQLDVRSAPGRGTEFVLDVPVSMTAAPALIVEAGDVAATIPLDVVKRTARIAAKDIAYAPGGDVVTDEGVALHFASLARILGLPSVTTDLGEALSVVVLESDGSRVAVGVDRVLGIASAVVHPLPSPVVADALVVGASLDGVGDPRLALDPRLLVEVAAALRGAPRGAALREKRAVLVVDDSLTSRMLERSILEAAGYDVTTAASAEEALEVARARSFELFVVDVEMPGKSGFDFVALTRADPALADTPAVLVTSRASVEDRRRGLEVGARAYIVKGEFAQDEFLDAVRRLVR
jgi:two-component system chemotaxis sensor kinase CheA